MIDHASRFIVTCATSEPPTAEWLIQVFRHFWVAPFAAPKAVLCDRGSEFMSDLFTSFITNIIRAYIVPTSSYYPQGNAVNEASHKSLDSMLSVCCNQYNMIFQDALFHASLIHNSTPHVSTGHSPFFMLHGLEPVLPGFQSLQRAAGPEDHLAEVNNLRNNALCRTSLLSSPISVRTPSVKCPIKVGDWVVYLLPTASIKVKADLPNKFSRLWSLPAKVIRVADKQITALHLVYKHQS